MGYELTFIGLLLSLFFIGAIGVYPGGIIVPGYLVLFIHQPERIGGTLIAALITVYCFKMASRYVILFGRRRFVFMILVGGIWAFLGVSLFPFILPGSMEFRVIGWVVPGLIANNFERQGVWVTTAALATVTVLTFFCGRLISLIG